MSPRGTHALHESATSRSISRRVVLVVPQAAGTSTASAGLGVAAWQAVEPEIDDGDTEPVERVGLDALRMPPDRLLTPRALRNCRSGPATRSASTTVETHTRGMHQPGALHDLDAMNKTEMLLWEDWGGLD